MNIFEIMRCVSLGTMKAKRVKEGGEFSKPFPRSLFEAIERFMETTNVIREYWILETMGLLHIDCFLKVSMKKSIRDIKLVNMPVMCDCKSD